MRVTRAAWTTAAAVAVLAASIATVAADDDRIVRNEAAAIATLREIVEAQRAFQAARACDLDLDGVGEFGMFRELSGASPVRATVMGSTTLGARVETPLLPGEFGVLNRNREVARSGYLFKDFLPGYSGVAVSETAGTSNFSAAVTTCSPRPRGAATRGRRRTTRPDAGRSS